MDYNIKDINNFLSDIETIIEKKIKSYLKENDCLIKRVAKVGTVTGSSVSATVYFPPYDKESTVSYKNISGQTLTTNDYVYLFTSFSNPDQGWIMVKK